MNKQTEQQLLPDGSDFIIITACYPGSATDVNTLSNEQLSTQLSNLGYKGLWRYRGHIIGLIAGKKISLTEDLYLVTGAELYELLLLGVKHKQMSILKKEAGCYEILDTKVGRTLFSVTEDGDRAADFFEAYGHYFKSRHPEIAHISHIRIEQHCIPTLSDSLMALKQKQGLASTRWETVLSYPDDK